MVPIELVKDTRGPESADPHLGALASRCPSAGSKLTGSWLPQRELPSTLGWTVALQGLGHGKKRSFTEKASKRFVFCR